MRVVTESPCRFLIAQQGLMRVPGVVFATHALLPDPAGSATRSAVITSG
jgi:tRNA-splicing ligase RtcB